MGRGIRESGLKLLAAGRGKHAAPRYLVRQPWPEEEPVTSAKHIGTAHFALSTRNLFMVLRLSRAFHPRSGFLI